VTKPSKLYARLLANPAKPIAFRELEQVVAAFGFAHVRTTGSHRGWEHPSVPRLLVLQPRGKEAKPYQQRQFLDMVEQYRLEIDG
jgi:predicted RNA binding protein YcfA (HicA-like mRNA interferase family)